jgi:hypothetical protein
MREMALASPARRREMAEAGRGLVRENFNAESIALDLMRQMGLERKLP